MYRTSAPRVQAPSVLQRICEAESSFVHPSCVGFDVIALSKSGKEDYMGNLICLPLPLDKDEFLRTVEILVTTESSFTSRNLSDSEYISNAKAILMNTNDMSEMQAHKFLQSESMRCGKKMVDVAKDIIAKFE